MTIFATREYHRMETNFLEKRILMIAVVLLTAATALAACEDDEEVQAPEDVATEFLDNLRSGERQAAMDAIWPPTRRELKEAVEELEEHVDEDSPVDTSDILVVTRLESPFLFASLDIEGDVPDEPDDGEEAPLTIEYRDGRKAEIVLRWGDDDGRWYVDLPLEQRRSLNVPAQESDEDPSSDEDPEAEDQPNDESSTDDERLDSMDDEIVDDE